MTDTATIYVEEFGFTLDLKVDLSKYQHSGPATKALHKALRKLAQDLGQDPDEVMLVRPEDNELIAHEYISGWGICWEGGPYEWAVNIKDSNGHFISGPWGYAEPGYSFNLSMINDRRSA
tara:strand:- start:298 stop:657 length:360 start_codon:yes stop_codon:yes gene_type:complete